MVGSCRRSKNLYLSHQATVPTGIQKCVPKLQQGRHVAEAAIKNDLPAKLPPTKAEIALWRAFLADEIEAILRDGE
jgi:hypothetical protein